MIATIWAMGKPEAIPAAVGAFGTILKCLDKDRENWYKDKNGTDSENSIARKCTNTKKSA